MALLSKCGDSILLGQSRGGGFLALLDAASLRCIDLVKVGQGGIGGGGVIRSDRAIHPSLHAGFPSLVRLAPVCWG